MEDDVIVIIPNWTSVIIRLYAVFSLLKHLQRNLQISFVAVHRTKIFEMLFWGLGQNATIL